MKTDIELQRDVLDELKYEPSVDAAEIGVAVKDGIVTLSGIVPNYLEKLAAERAAKRVFGVKGVAEEIEVHLPMLFQRTDADIARAAVNALEWNALVPSEKLKVTISKGRLTLEGEVDFYYQKTAARDAVHALSGVKSLQNDITIKPKVTATVIKSEIAAAFKRNVELDAEHITVHAKGDTVTLSGHVRNLAERTQAEQTAFAAGGVSKVTNDLLIEP